MEGDAGMAGELDLLFLFGMEDRQDVEAALEMLMVQNRAPDDREVAIGADEEMREGIDEGDQSREDAAGDLHRGMRFVEEDAMLLKIAIGGILEIPLLPVKR